MYALIGAFCSLHVSIVVFCSSYASVGTFCSQYTSTNTFYSIFTFLRALIFLCVLLFRGVMSFWPIGLPRFRRILGSFANCPSRTLIRAGAIFVAGICDFVTIFVLINAFGN